VEPENNKITKITKSAWLAAKEVEEDKIGVVVKVKIGT